MARQLILHIGTMKTGSTSIQQVLGANRPAMLAQGAYYPATPNENNHMLLAMIFTSSPEAYSGFGNVLWRGRDPLTYLAETQDRFVAEMKSLPASVNRVIISSEQFSQLVRKPADIARVKALMAPFFDSYKVVVYLRRQDSHVASNHSQTLRRGVVRKPGFQRVRDSSSIYDYAALIDAWAAEFGEAAMCPRIFERGADGKFDVVADFNALCGLEGLEPPDAAAKASNPSMNAAGQRILRQIGLMLKEKQGPDFARTALWKRLTTAVTEALPGRGWQPTQAEAREFVEEFAVPNETVRKRWFPERASLFSTDYSDLPAVQPEIDRKEEAHATYTVLLHVMQETLDREQEAGKRKLDTSKNADKPARRAALIRTIRRDPTDADAHVQLAGLQIEEGALKAARYNLEKALKIVPDHPRGLELLEKV